MFAWWAKSSLVALVSAAVLAGCGGTGSAPALPDSSAAASYTSRTQFLYVANLATFTGFVSVFPLGKSRPVLRIEKGINDPAKIAFDAAGNVYVGNEGSVSVYAPGRKFPNRKLPLGLGTRGDLAFDASGNLYVAYAFGRFSSLSIYPPGKSHPQRVITNGITEPVSIAFDSSNNLYVANQSYPGTVNVYPPGGSTPMRTLRGKLIKPTSMAFDPSGNLYVADEGTYGRGTKVLVYGPGDSSPTRVIRRGVKGAVALAFDSSGNLYVASVFTAQYNKPRGIVSVYPPGAQAPSYELGPSDSDEFFLGIDAQDDLYVGHRGSLGSISVYPPGARKPSRKITAGIKNLQGLAISPG